MAALSTLERKIDRHMKDSDDKMKLFKSELQLLKTIPKLTKRPSTVTKPKEVKQLETVRKAVTTTMKPKVDEKKSLHTPKKAVNSIVN